MKKITKILATISMALTFGSCWAGGKKDTSDNKTYLSVEYKTWKKNFDDSKSKKKDFSSLEAADFVVDMKIGWNLGNTMDAVGARGMASETSWSQPKTSQAMIKKLAESGIKTIRIPTSWHNHLTDKNYTVDPKWMARVKEIVDWAIAEDMYVILNTHHDNAESSNVKYGQGYYPLDESREESLRFLVNVWSQICLTFNNSYDDHLIFETMNEPRLKNTDKEWWLDPNDAMCTAALDMIMEYNQEIVNTIRKSGGNNAKRFIMVPSYAASPDTALNEDFYMPKDSASNRLLLSVHMYSPHDFAMQDPGTKFFTGVHKSQLKSMFQRLTSKFAYDGYPVVIGECGATNKNNLEERENWFQYFFGQAMEEGMPAVFWDNGAAQVNENGPYDEHFGYFDRNRLEWYFPTLIESAFKGLAGDF